MSKGSLAVEFNEERIDALFAALNQSHLPGAAVGIAIAGRPVYRKGFGLANMELPVTLLAMTRVRIASITKHFTCLAYLLLCEEGRAELDDPLGVHLPELNPAIREVTMSQLMGHISGIRDVLDIGWYFSGTGMSASSADLLALYRDIDDVNAPPAAVWSYNNGGYLLLSAVIERIAGEPLEEVFRKRIFAPLGMHDTLLRRLENDFLPMSATRHMTTADGKFAKWDLRTATAGEGGIVSTVDDMLRWLAHMDEPKVGSTSTWHAMKTAQRLANGACTSYGLGLLLDQYRGAETLSHSGSLPGVNAQMLKVPAVGLDIVVLVNRNDVSAVSLANRILDDCLSGLKPIVARKSVARPIATGVFKSPTSGRVIQLLDRDGQQIVAIDAGEWKLDPDDEGVLRPQPDASWYQIAVTLRGCPATPHGIELNYYGSCDELLRESESHQQDFNFVFGSYWSRSTGSLAEISRTMDGVTLKTTGRFGSTEYALERIADRIWRASSTNLIPADAILSFASEGSGFYFSTWRTRSLVFTREA